MKPQRTTATRRASAHLTAVIALLAALFAVLPNTASAATLVTPDGEAAPRVYQTWMKSSALPTPDATILIRQGSGPCAAAACSTYEPATVWMGVHADRRDLLHEIGHHFDAATMTDGARAAFGRLAGTGARSWRGGGDSPHERFAVAYSLCAASPTTPDASSWDYGYRPSVTQHRSVCRLIQQVAGR